jgi:Lon-like ATP-dependent protease
MESFRKGNTCKKDLKEEFMLSYQNLLSVLVGIQFFFSCVIGMYFLLQIKNSKTTKSVIHKEAPEKCEELAKLRGIYLTEPLTEKMRPKQESDIIGQEEGLLALKTALCTPNPQHILIYGSPGVGKTAAARIVLNEAKKHASSPFRPDAKFVEIDATTLRFDERSVADPLMGSVHDPIYQGAGAYGSAGVPQPKPGAVTKAHGGILFIDEIGELHPVQMNKLLKVLEDRKVFFESAYYSAKDERIPKHIHDMFKNGLPADFRLIGATTRSREEIPAALRSRCVEISFKDLTVDDIHKIIENILVHNPVLMDKEAVDLIAQYASNGRDAVNIFQTSYNKAKLENKEEIALEDVEWVIKQGGYTSMPQKFVNPGEKVGKINGLGYIRPGQGTLLEVQSIAKKVETGKGEIKITGIIEEEEIHGHHTTSKRKSMAHSSLENVLTLLKTAYHVKIEDYYIHLNFPSGVPIDGPSAGIAIFCSLYSALFNEAMPQTIAMTGEITIHGEVYPVGGVTEKIMAAQLAGVKKVFIPFENMQKSYHTMPIKIIPVKTVQELMQNIEKADIMTTANTVLHA